MPFDFIPTKAPFRPERRIPARVDPARARLLETAPAVWPRTPPIRERKTIPTAWVELVIREGRNRQVRRMTAAVGFPTLRLLRAAIGPYTLDGLAPGTWDTIPAA